MKTKKLMLAPIAALFLVLAGLTLLRESEEERETLSTAEERQSAIGSEASPGAAPGAAEPFGPPRPTALSQAGTDRQISGSRGVSDHPMDRGQAAGMTARGLAPSVAAGQIVKSDPGQYFFPFSK